MQMIYFELPERWFQYERDTAPAASFRQAEHFGCLVEREECFPD
jgi:hypothetical protein